MRRPARPLWLVMLGLLVIGILASCAPSEEAIQAAIQATANAMPTTTPEPTHTATPISATSTHTPTRTTQPTKTVRPTNTPNPTVALIGLWVSPEVTMDLRDGGRGVLTADDGSGGNVKWRVEDGKLCIEITSTTECFGYDLLGDRMTIGLAVYNRRDPALPRATSIPTIAPTPTPESITLTGSGDSIIDIEKWSGPALVHITGNTAGNHFAVKNFGASGDNIDLLVNTADPYDGVRLIDLFDGQNTVRFEVNATGPWEIEVMPFLSENFTIAEVPGSTSGTGDSVLLLTDDPDIATITGNAGGHHFAVQSYGESFDLLVNTADPYNGQVMIEPGSRIIAITATGDWTIEFTAR